MRDYSVMREVLSVVARAKRSVSFYDFDRVQPNNLVESELRRLIADGLVEGDVRYDAFGTCQAFNVEDLTDEGVEFWRLLENDDAWHIILDTLRKADIDVSYPLLKEVCEEIVKSYVTSFIPDVPKRQ